jgi:hypothetical protein
MLLGGEFQATAMSCRQQLRLAMLAVAPNRPHCV